MRPDINEINIHLLLSNDINRLREMGKYKKKSLSFFSDIFFCLVFKSFIKIIKNDSRKL